MHVSRTTAGGSNQIPYSRSICNLAPLDSGNKEAGAEKRPNLQTLIPFGLHNGSLLGLLLLKDGACQFCQLQVLRLSLLYVKERIGLISTILKTHLYTPIKISIQPHTSHVACVVAIKFTSYKHIYWIIWVICQDWISLSSRLFHSDQTNIDVLVSNDWVCLLFVGVC